MTPSEALAGSPLRVAQWASASPPSSMHQVQYRQAGEAAQVTHVLLHGIGSGSASWAYQLASSQGERDRRVLAWDAPGYGQSTPLPMAQPQARDYAERLWQWLDALQVHAPVCLVGHSLGALMVASAARLQPARVTRVVLLSPARGYGQASDDERQRIVQGRLNNLQQLGPAGMAQARAAAMLAPDTRADWLAAVRENMAQVNPAGYTQATHMLGQGRLLDDVAALRCPLTVASGEADGITPPEACDTVAAAAGRARVSLGAVGHACALEAAEALDDLLFHARD